MAKQNNEVPVVEVVAPIELVAKIAKPKVKLIRASDGSEVDVEIVSTKYESPAAPKDANAETLAAFKSRVLELAVALVAPIDAQIDAFLTFANSLSYRTAKDAIFSSGEYVTPDEIDAVCIRLSMLPQFADLKKSDQKSRFLEGVKGQKPGAMKLLEEVRQQLSLSVDF